jgi:gamma-glutamyltranspeptidase/glutathione hydrolase
MPNTLFRILAALLFSALSAAHADYSTPVTAKQQMVVSAHAIASRIGNDILDQGGNAVDAAVATAYALAVVHPCCGNLGGGGFITLHLAADDRDLTLNFREKAPLAASHDMYLDTNGEVDHQRLMNSYLSIGVPGTVLGLDTALSRYGTLNRQQVMAPAIVLARDGFELTRDDTKLLVLGTRRFGEQPNVAAIFLRDGRPYRPGERLIQTDLANSLSLIAEQGPKAFYDGPIAGDIVAASQASGGVLSLADFNGYTVSEQAPIRCDYRGYQVLSMPPPSSGGVTLCLMLNVLEGYPLADLGFNSAATLHLMVETMRRAYVSRNRLLADPRFVTNPIEALLSNNYAQQLRSHIDPERATPLDDLRKQAALDSGQAEATDTTHLSVLDKHGNAVALTYTINGYFGNGRIAGNTGFFLNNEMGDFTAKPGVANIFGLVQGERNAVEPGKQPLSSMSPTLVKKDGEVFLVLGSPGGARIITIVLQAIINIIDFDMNLAEAVNASRIHNQWLPDRVFYEPRAFTRDTEALLSGMGYTLQRQPPWGALEAIMRVPDEGLDDGPETPDYPDSVQGRYRLPGLIYGANDARRPRGLAVGR